MTNRSFIQDEILIHVNMADFLTSVTNIQLVGILYLLESAVIVMFDETEVRARSSILMMNKLSFAYCCFHVGLK